MARRNISVSVHARVLDKGCYHTIFTNVCNVLATLVPVVYHSTL